MSALETLQSCELFIGLSGEELQEIAAIAREDAYEEGDLILAEDELAERLFILSEGRVQVHIRLRSLLEPYGETTIEEVEPGRIFGWSSMVKQRRLTASVKALEPVKTLVMDVDELNALFDRNAHIGFVVMKQLAEVIASRLRHTREACEQRATESKLSSAAQDG